MPPPWAYVMPTAYRRGSLSLAYEPLRWGSADEAAPDFRQPPVDQLVHAVDGKEQARPGDSARTSSTLSRHQFVVAPLEPDRPGIKPRPFVGVEEPNGIAIPNEPPRGSRPGNCCPATSWPWTQSGTTFEPSPSRPTALPRRRPQQTFTPVWYPDGVVGAPYSSVPEEARMVLYGCRFQYKQHEAAFVLPAAYSTAERALFVQAVVSQLTAAGIGVDFRHAATPPTTSPRPPVPAASNASLPARHR
jgi:hypothetical protein